MWPSRNQGNALSGLPSNYTERFIQQHDIPLTGALAASFCRRYSSLAALMFIVRPASACRNNGEDIWVLMLMREQDLEADIGKISPSNCFAFSRVNDSSCALCRISFRHAGIKHRVYEFVLLQVKQLRLRLWNTQTRLDYAW